jgi:hypothetical protein
VAWKNRVPVHCVVHNVADEKNGRECEGQKHARTMRFPVVMFDEIESHAEYNCAQSIQKRVEGWQKHPATCEISGSMMHV